MTKLIHIARQWRALALALFACAAVASAVAGSLNPMGKAVGAMAAAPQSRAAADDEKETYVPVIVELAGDFAPLPEPAVLLHRRGRLALANVPEASLGEFAARRDVVRVEAHATAAPRMVAARQYAHLEEAEAAIAASGLTADRVVVGFFDTGFDPHHSMMADADGRTRVRRLRHYTTESAYPLAADTPEEIGQWATDSPDQWHATHVAGIMTGRYTGTRGNYSGLAPDAEIVGCTGQLYPAYILAGCEDVVEYARSVDKPAVINISISSELGPRDGTTLFNQYMEELARDAVVVISAGNDGHKPAHVRRRLHSGFPQVRTWLRQWPSNAPIEVAGAVDVWLNADAAEPGVNFVVLDNATRSVAYRFATVNLAEKVDTWAICSEGFVETLGADMVADRRLPEGYEGYAYVVAEENPYNRRLNATLYINIKCLDPTPDGDALLVFGLEVAGTDGQVVDIHASETLLLASNGDRQASQGDASWSINDMACSPSVVSVGAMASNDRLTFIDGSSDTASGLTPGYPAYFSSYATLDDGRRLPTVTAPGGQIVSAFSGPFVEAHPEAVGIATFAEDAQWRTMDYWRADQGTSMSSPFVAGTLALWWNLAPQLTPMQIRDILAQSIAEPVNDATNPQWGGGMLDASAGLTLVQQTGATAQPDDFGIAVRREYYSIAGARLTAPATSSPYITVESNSQGMRRTLKCMP